MMKIATITGKMWKIAIINGTMRKIVDNYRENVNQVYKNKSWEPGQGDTKCQTQA